VQAHRAAARMHTRARPHRLRGAAQQQTCCHAQGTRRRRTAGAVMARLTCTLHTRGHAPQRRDTEPRPDPRSAERHSGGSLRARLLLSSAIPLAPIDCLATSWGPGQGRGFGGL
jgi:hypothetical protein